MRFNIGDRVRNTEIEIYKDEPIVVVATLYKNNRYHIRYLNVFNVQGTCMMNWVHEDTIELDKEYYRDIKLNEILNEI